MLSLQNHSKVNFVNRIIISVAIQQLNNYVSLSQRLVVQLLLDINCIVDLKYVENVLKLFKCIKISNRREQ